MRSWRTALWAVVLALPAVAMAQEPLDTDATATEEPERAPISPRSADPTPFATVQAMRALHWKNQLEITLARHALARAERPEVRRYAERVILDHQMADQRVLELADTLGLDLRPPAAEEQAQTETTQAQIQELQALSGVEFEQAWLRMMIAGHRQTIQQLARLRPQVDSEELRTLIRKLMPILDQHLVMARHLRSGQRVGVLRTGPNAPLWIQLITQAWR